MKRILSIISAGVLALMAASCVHEDLVEFDASKATAPVLNSFEIGDKDITAAYTPGSFNQGFNEKIAPNHALALVSVGGQSVSKILTTSDKDGVLTLKNDNLAKALMTLGQAEGSFVDVELVVRATMQDPSKDNGINGFVDSQGRISVKGFEVVIPEVVGSPYADYTEASNWTVIGALSAYEINWDGDLNMWTDGTNHVAAHVTLKAGDEFKFRQDLAWTVNMGGTFTELGSEFTVTQDGSNIVVGTDGVYDLFLNPTDGVAWISAAYDPYPAFTEASNWSVIGSLTKAGIEWDGDIPMVTDGTSHIAFGVALDADDEFKFRQDAAWTVNLGGEFGGIGNEFAVVQDGANIKVGTEGVYDLMVNPGAGTAIVNEASGMKISAPVGGDEPEPEPEPVTGWNIIGLNGNWDTDILATEADGVWTAYITAEGDTEFKWRKDGGWDENYGGVMVALDEPFEAVAGGDNIKISAGFWKVVFDSNNLTITVSEGNVWSLIGDFNSWAGDVDMTLVDGKWTVSNVALTPGWKLRKNHGWDDNRGGVFVAFDEPFEVTNGGDNIDCGEGTFNVVYDPETETVTVSNAAKVWGVIGDFNGWDGDVTMTEVMPGIWVSDPITTEGGWKIRFDGGWDVNRGGALSKQGEFAKAVPGGDNITLAGTFKVVYNANNETIGTLGWGVTGSIASAGVNWDKDIPMNLGTDGKWYSVPMALTTADQFKIRYNAGWDENFGGDFTAVGEAFEAVAGGNNISVAEDGTYMLVYDPEAATLTVTKEYWGLIGNFNGWSGDVFMICQGAGVWAAYGQTLGAEWKIRQACGWDVNRGGDFAAFGEPFEAKDGGNNISAGDGAIDIVYNASDETFTITE